MSSSGRPWVAALIVMIYTVADAPAQITPLGAELQANSLAGSGPLDVKTGTETPSLCSGDCDGDGSVTVDELVTIADIALAARPLEDCAAADVDSSQTIDVGELLLAVRRALEGCPAEGAVFKIRACASLEDPEGQTFHALIRDPAVIAQAEELVGAGQQQILSGALLAGDGGFNGPWSWHLDPDTIGFSDVTIELCDGCPSFVEENLDYWLGVVGQYCPWTTEVVERER